MSNHDDPRLARVYAPRIAEGAQVHESCHIGQGAQVSAEAVLCADVRLGGHVILEGAVHLGPSVTVHAFSSLIGPLSVGEGALIGTGAVIGFPSADTENRHTRLMDYCRLGQGAQVLAGVRVGRQARVRTGCVVTGDVPHYGLAAQNPAILTAYVCSLCGGLLEQAGLDGDVVNARCTGCAADGFKFIDRYWSNPINRILLPHHTFGARVTPLSNPRPWRDEEEIEVS